MTKEKNVVSTNHENSTSHLQYTVYNHVNSYKKQASIYFFFYKCIDADKKNNNMRLFMTFKFSPFPKLLCDFVKVLSKSLIEPLSQYICTLWSLPNMGTMN